MFPELYKLISIVRKEENYIPREYSTIGGMWAVDTWKLGNITLQIMDEGYTSVITSPELQVKMGYNGEEYVKFIKGTIQDVKTILQET